MWGLAAVWPRYPADFAIENLLVFALLGALVLLRKRVRLSARSTAFLVAFLCLHEIGAHYTYSEVPYDAWFRALTGRGLDELAGARRNHYDRLVHFLGGALLIVPIRELVRPHVFGRTAASFVALSCVMSGSLLYELLEWMAALVFGGALGAAYLGTQGDVWDAQKDMALAVAGALLSLVLSWLGRKLSDARPHTLSSAGRKPGLGA